MSDEKIELEPEEPKEDPNALLDPLPSAARCTTPRKGKRINPKPRTPRATG